MKAKIDTRAEALAAHERLMSWARTLDSSDLLLEVVAAVEALCEEANAGARAVGLVDVAEDGTGGRLDVLEEHRNAGLRALLLLRANVNEVRIALTDLAHNPLARREFAPLFLADEAAE